MNRSLPPTLALLVGLIPIAQAQVAGGTHGAVTAGLIPALLSSQSALSGMLAVSQATPTPFQEGQRVTLVGRITSAPKTVAGVREERKMQVAIGPGNVDFTLHMSDAALLGANGRKVEADDLVDKQWVRAVGTVMEDPRRIRVTKLKVIGGSDRSLRRSAYYRPGFERGYVMATVGGSRKIFPAAAAAAGTPVPIMIVGKVSDDTGTFENTRKIQVDAAGATWTLHVPGEARITDAKGEPLSVHEVSEGQWIRAHGWQTDDLRVKVRRIENIGPAEARRASR